MGNIEKIRKAVDMLTELECGIDNVNDDDFKTIKRVLRTKIHTIAKEEVVGEKKNWQVKALEELMVKGNYIFLGPQEKDSPVNQQEDSKDVINVRVQTREEYDSLLKNLKDRGYTWYSGDELCEDFHIFDAGKENTVICIDEDNKDVSWYDYSRDFEGNKTVSFSKYMNVYSISNVIGDARKSPTSISKIMLSAADYPLDKNDKVEQELKTDYTPFGEEEEVQNIHVETQEQYDRLMKYLEEQGVRWELTGRLPTEINLFGDLGSDLFIFIDEGKKTCGRSSIEEETKDFYKYMSERGEIERHQGYTGSKNGSPYIGYVTIKELAEKTGESKSAIYHRITHDEDAKKYKHSKKWYVDEEWYLDVYGETDDVKEGYLTIRELSEKTGHKYVTVYNRVMDHEDAQAYEAQVDLKRKKRWYVNEEWYREEFCGQEEEKKENVMDILNKNKKIIIAMLHNLKSQASIAKHLGVSDASLSRRIHDNDLQDVKMKAEESSFLGNLLSKYFPNE